MAWPSGAQAIGGMAVSQDGALYVTPTGAASITSGTISGITAFSTGQLASPFTVQWGANATDTWSISTAGTLAGQSNAGGIKTQIVLSGAPLYRVSSDGVFAFNSTTTLASGAIDTGLARNGAGIVEANNGTAGTLGAFKANYFATAAPVTTASASYTVLTESYLITNVAGTCTLTLPAAASFIGRRIVVKTITVQTVVSATSNVVPRAGGAAGTAILAAAAGNWAELVSNGTNWEIMAGTP